jgi:DNA/RNA-binding domain of Phe-tRNA-synthetase-like protein
MPTRSLTVEDEIFRRFPGVRLAAVIAEGVDNAREYPGIEAMWRDVWAGALSAGQYGNAQQHPRMQPWRERFRAMGVSGKEFPNSAEALLRRALKGGEPFKINPLVDFYNAVSLENFVPVGAFDLDQLSGPLELRITRAGDTFTALDADAPLDVPPGEVAYCNGSDLLTRHFVWRQSRLGLVSADTRSVFIVSEVLGDVDSDGSLAAHVADELRSGVERYFGVQPIGAYVVSAEQPEIEW